MSICIATTAGSKDETTGERSAMARLIEVTVMEPREGQWDKCVGGLKAGKAIFLGHGVLSVEFSSGNVGQHFGCIMMRQVFASGEDNGRINDALSKDPAWSELYASFSGTSDVISHDSYYEMDI